MRTRGHRRSDRAESLIESRCCPFHSIWHRVVLLVVLRVLHHRLFPYRRELRRTAGGLPRALAGGTAARCGYTRKATNTHTRTSVNLSQSQSVSVNLSQPHLALGELNRN